MLEWNQLALEPKQDPDATEWSSEGGDCQVYQGLQVKMSSLAVITLLIFHPGILDGAWELVGLQCDWVPGGWSMMGWDRWELLLEYEVMGSLLKAIQSLYA